MWCTPQVDTCSHNCLQMQVERRQTCVCVCVCAVHANIYIYIYLTMHKSKDVPVYIQMHMYVHWMIREMHQILVFDISGYSYSWRITWSKSACWKQNDREEATLDAQQWGSSTGPLKEYPPVEVCPAETSKTKEIANTLNRETLGALGVPHRTVTRMCIECGVRCSRHNSWIPMDFGTQHRETVCDYK